MRPLGRYLRCVIIGQLKLSWRERLSKPLFVSLLFVVTAVSLRAQSAEVFTLGLRLKGQNIDTLLTLRAPGADNLAVLPPAELPLSGGRTVQRIESASLYRKNYLAGQGLTLQFVEVGGRPGPKGRQRWIKQLLKRMPSEPSIALGTEDLERFVRSGVEVRYRHADGKLYRAAYGDGARVTVTLVSISRVKGTAPGGFGDYTVVLFGGIAGTLVSADGQQLSVMGTFRMGMFAPAE